MKFLPVPLSIALLGSLSAGLSGGETQTLQGDPGSRSQAPSSPLAPPLGGGDDAGFGEIVEGGSTGPQGQEIQCDLPPSLRAKNVGGRDGAGLCVFTSIMHAARYQNEPRLWDFQKQMRQELGGGYPEKVDRMIAKYAPGVKYVQHTGGDLEFVRKAIQSGRMPCVTYAGNDPHYGRQKVDHMVNASHLSGGAAAILDNNFIGEKQILWMSEADFDQRWKDRGGGWCFCLVGPPPPPAPRN